MAAYNGAGNDPAVLAAQIGVRRFAEVAGGQHVPEIILGEVQSQQHAGNLAVMLHRGVEHRHHLVGDSGPEHLHAALPLHAVQKIVPVPAVAGLAVGGRIEALGIGEADGVEGGVLLHPPEQFRGNLRPVLAGAQQIGVVAHPELGAVEFALDPPGCLVGGIHGIIQVLVLDSAPVRGGIPLEQQANPRQQDTDIYDVLPVLFRYMHKMSPPSAHGPYEK